MSNEREKKRTINFTEFAGQPNRLCCGHYEATGNGVSYFKGSDPVTVIAHPLTVSRRLINMESGDQKIELAFKRAGRPWEYRIVNQSEIATQGNITKLKDKGISVTQINAREVIKYLQFLEDANDEEIPTMQSCGHFGFADRGKAFVPYVGTVVFDGDTAFKPMADAITTGGNFEVWKRAASEITRHPCARIALAASFASVLIEPLSGLCFFVHLWGETGTGKSVVELLVSSVWGNPEGLVKTFNSTSVGHERTAEFLRNLPFVIDESQLTTDETGKVRFSPYELAQGCGKARGNTAGGVDRTGYWRLAIITTGETPLYQDNAASGSKNRVIDLPFRERIVTKESGQRLAEAFRDNFGHAGRPFVEWLMQNMEKARGYFQDAKTAFRDTTVSSKQIDSAAFILAADRIITSELHLLEAAPLTINDLMPYLKTDADLDSNRALYDDLCQWVVMNMARFNPDNWNSYSEVYGDSDSEYWYIIKKEFKRTVTELNGNPTAFLKWLTENGHIKPGSKNNPHVRPKRIKGNRVDCVALKKISDLTTDELDDLDLCGKAEIPPQFTNSEKP